MDVYPTLTYRDVKAALKWIAVTFALEPRIFSDEGDQTIHAALIRGNGMVLIESEKPEDLHGSHLGQGWVYVAIDDIDSHYSRSKAAGAEVLNEPHSSADGGMRGYSARDPEGNLWTFGTARPQP